MYNRLSTLWQEWNQQYYQQNHWEPEACNASVTNSKGHKRPASPDDPKRGSKKAMTSVSSSSNNDHTNDLTDGFIYNTQYRVLICISCGSIIQPEAKSFYSYLNSIHRITGLACKILMESFRAYKLCPFEKLAVPKEKILQIAGLPIHGGFRCNICPQISESSYFTDLQTRSETIWKFTIWG